MRQRHDAEAASVASAALVADRRRVDAPDTVRAVRWGRIVSAPLTDGRATARAQLSLAMHAWDTTIAKRVRERWEAVNAGHAARDDPAAALREYCADAAAADAARALSAGGAPDGARARAVACLRCFADAWWLLLLQACAWTRGRDTTASGTRSIARLRRRVRTFSRDIRTTPQTLCGACGAPAIARCAARERWY